MPQPTKQAEYRRSAEMFEDLYKTQGAYFALAILIDSQYDNKDLKEVLNYIKPEKRPTK